MEVKFLNQPKEVKLGEILNDKIRGDFENIFIVAGMAKDTGIEDIYDAIVDARRKSNNVTICVGIDRKNTSKDMLMKLIDVGCSLGVHINTDESKVESRVCVFESKSGPSYIYTTGGKLSTGGLFENASIIAEIKYGSDEKKLFEIAKNNILQGMLSEFHQIDRDELILLAEKGEIVVRITERKIPRIGDIYKNADTIGVEQVSNENVYDETTNAPLINFDELEDVEIDLEPGIVIRKEVELATENEALKERKAKEKMLKSLKKTDADLEKLYGKKSDLQEETKLKKTIKMNDALDYENMTTLIIESNKIIEKGAGAGEFKIPKSVAENLEQYFSENVVVFKIMDNADNSEVVDSEVKIIKSDKGISILSEELIKLSLEEGDLVRIIKESDNEYKCEIIRNSTEEYNIWSCYCNHSIRGQKRKYGII